jgi:hypothetical protein
MRESLAKTSLLLATLVMLAASWAGWTTIRDFQAIGRYRPEIGDVIVQSITPCGRLLRTIKGVTESKWCHCGVVDRKDDSWVVCEAVGNGVRYTPLAYFLLRGETIDFAAYRLAGDFRRSAGALAACCGKYVGRPYDIQYELDDEKIYCSELVYKAFRDATGGDELRVVQRFGDLNWKPFEKDIAFYHGSEDLPFDRLVITPAALTTTDRMQEVVKARVSLPWHASRAILAVLIGLWR